MSVNLSYCYFLSLDTCLLQSYVVNNGLQIQSVLFILFKEFVMMPQDLIQQLVYEYDQHMMPEKGQGQNQILIYTSKDKMNTLFSYNCNNFN